MAGWQREFDDLRSRRALIPTDRENAVWDHYTGTLERDEIERENLPGQAAFDKLTAEIYAKAERNEIAGIDPLSILDATLELKVAQKASVLSSRARKAKLADLCKHLSKGETALIAHEVDEYLLQNRLLVERSSHDWISLARHMMRAEVEALKHTFERDRGDYSGQVGDPLVKPPTSKRRGSTEVAAPGEAIAEVLTAFKEENSNNVPKLAFTNLAVMSVSLLK